MHAVRPPHSRTVVGMRRSWPFLVYVVVAIVHLVQILTGLPGRDVTKPLLMASLALAVVLVAFVTDRTRIALAPRRTSAIVLLLLGIVASMLGDILLGPSFIGGLGCFALAHLMYVVLFSTSVRRRVIPWWTLAYVAWIVALAIVLWPHLSGDLQIPVVCYGAVLALTAMTSARVNAWTTLGGALFLLSDSTLALRMFWPGFGEVFPDPWQDATIMLTYCLGEGLIAFGVLRALATRPASDRAPAPDRLPTAKQA